MPKNQFADLHCHPSFKNFNRSRIEKKFLENNDDYNLWTEGTWNDGKEKRAERNGAGISTYEQSALLDCYSERQGEGDATTKILFASLYPLERGWLLGNPDEGIDMAQISEYTKKQNDNLFTRIKNAVLKKVIGTLNTDDEIRSVMQGLYIGIPREIIYFMQGHTDFSNISPKKWLLKNLNPPYDYFIDLIHEYNFVKRKNDIPIKVKGRNLSYKTILTKKDLADNATNELQTGVVLTIEGAHVFSIKHDGSKLVRRSMDEMLTNVNFIKSWGTFFITMCHHFDNGLCGHAHSHPVPLNYFVNQKKSMNAGFLAADGSEISNADLSDTDGEKIIKKLLSIGTDGKRISGEHRVLIDVKHMSPKSRERFYRLIDKINSDNQTTIPIIASHVAYSGTRTLTELINRAPTGDFTIENADSIISRPSYVGHPGTIASYYNWGINLCDEDVVVIVKSKGLIGITFDQRVLGYEGNSTKKNPVFWAQVILNTMLAFAHAWKSNCGEDEKNLIWNCLCIGTDFDGIIDPVNDFAANFEFPDFKIALQQAIYNMTTDQKSFFNINDPLGETADSIIQKFCYDNAFTFLEKNLNS